MLKPCFKTKRRGANYGTGFLFMGSSAGHPNKFALCGG